MIKANVTFYIGEIQHSQIINYLQREPKVREYIEINNELHQVSKVLKTVHRIDGSIEIDLSLDGGNADREPIAIKAKLF